MSQHFLLTFIVLAVASTQAFAFSVQPQVDVSLAYTLLQSTAAIQSNPELSASCFGIYLPQLTTLTDQYKEQYEICTQTSENATDSINKEVQPNATTISQWQDSICKVYSNCTLDTVDPYNFFQCTNEAASNAVATSNNIQGLAKDRMEFLTMSYAMITYNKNTCIDLCSQTYQTQSKSVYAQLQGCLDGNAPQVLVSTAANDVSSSSSTTEAVPTTQSETSSSGISSSESAADNIPTPAYPAN